MDLSNLTFDELLDAIRSDSGYQNAQAQKINKDKPTQQITEEPAKEIFEESKAVYEAPKAEEADVTAEEPEKEICEEPEAVYEAPKAEEADVTAEEPEKEI